MNLPSEMRAVVLTGHGGLEVLEFRQDFPVPTPGHDEVIVGVTTCGMNNTDINTRTGWYSDGGWGGSLVFPLIQGADPAGRVVGVGADVDPNRIGERVLVDAWIRSSSERLADASYLGSELDGGYAEYVAVPNVNAHRIDTDLTDVELAASHARMPQPNTCCTAQMWPRISGFWSPVLQVE